MANMSYCRFENTNNDLQDCINEMDSIEGTLSKSEAEAFAEMVEKCRDIVLMFEDFDFWNLKEMSTEKFD